MIYERMKTKRNIYIVAIVDNPFDCSLWKGYLFKT